MFFSTKTYTDDDGVCTTRRIQRPAVISSYYKGANVIDVHNQLRQGILQYEKFWKTRTPWFRIITTIVFGMTLTDAFLLTKHAVKTKHVQKMYIKDFAAAVARDLVNMICFNPKLTSSAKWLPPLTAQIQNVYAQPQSGRSCDTNFSYNFEDNSSTEIRWSSIVEKSAAVPAGCPVVPQSVLILHPRGILEFLKKKNRARRRLCADPDCKSRTQYFCLKCQKCFCCDSNEKFVGRNCYYAHICKEYYNNGATFKFRIDYDSYQAERLKELELKTLKKGKK